MNSVVIIQARMGSRRLPGKVLARIGGRSLLERCILRLRPSGLPIIVATTELREDDEVEAEARRLDARVFRGERDDVLARYLGAAKTFGAEQIVRATADNPFVDPDATRRVLQHGQHLDVDHVVECGLPVGAAVEAIRVGSLQRAATVATDPYDREHVTSLIRRDPRFTSLRAVAPADHRRPGLRLTVDTEPDLEFARAIDAALGGHPGLLLPDVIRAADRLLMPAVSQSDRTRRGA
jgi:spore coat polysaccharide biosynthesis protein SpsF